MAKKLKQFKQEQASLVESAEEAKFHPSVAEKIAHTHKTAKWTQHSLDDMLAYADSVGKEQ